MLRMRCCTRLVSCVRSPYLLLVQGVPQAPMCGFSNMACAILNLYGACCCCASATALALLACTNQCMCCVVSCGRHAAAAAATAPVATN